MLKAFNKYLEEDLEVSKSDKLLIAVSGGVDSMVLWDICRKLGINFIVAHCNFKLRNEESEKDENFVLNHKTKDETVMSMSFDTKSFAKENGISTQMAARELRYTWFRQLMSECACKYIVTAHHKDDDLETVLIQILRKAEPWRIQGIRAKSGNVIRPLLFADKESILKYATDNHIPYREDSSNKEDYYLRNKIRNQLLPSIAESGSGFKEALADFSEKMRDFSTFLNVEFQKILDRSLMEKDGNKFIEKSTILGLSSPELFVQWLLRKEGFNPKSAKSIIKSLKGSSGKVYYGNYRRLLIEREYILISEVHDEGKELLEFTINELIEGQCDFLEAVEKSDKQVVANNSDANTAYFDMDLLGNKIQIRKWKEGDRFYPLGMKGSKKLSDFFIDEKYSQIEKERQWLLTTNGEICWIVGRRADERFKISENTSRILSLTLISEGNE